MDRQQAIIPQKASMPRFLLVDAFRFICAGWVMWVHIPQSEALAPTAGWMRFRLPFFVVLAVFFQQYQMVRRPVADFREYARERVRRLYFPFLAWGTLYFLGEGVHRVLTGRSWPVLTPEFVQDYVAAHEVAHLKHMNHGKRFWGVVNQLTPHAEAAIPWLRAEGFRLLRIG